MFDNTSPVETFSPLLGAEVIVDGGTTITPVTDETFEYGVLVDFGTVHVNGVEVTRNQLAYVAPGEPLAIQADDLAHLLLLGGPPFGEEIVMWWNFVGRDHSEIVEARADWMAQVTDNNGDPPGQPGDLRRPVRHRRGRPPPADPRPGPPQRPPQASRADRSRRVGRPGTPSWPAGGDRDARTADGQLNRHPDRAESSP